MGSSTVMCLVVAVGAMTTAQTVPTGPYKIASKTVEVPGMDETNRHVDLVYPDLGTTTNPLATDTQFPLIAYAHGFSDEGFESYRKLFDEMVSWGFVVAAARACKYGCIQDCKDLPFDPPCYGHYYKQQLKVIDWTIASSGLPINTSYGVGVSGHSMGGQSTLFASAYNSTAYNIKAAVMHHAFTHQYPAIPVPFLAFTGTDDTTAPPIMAEKIFDAPNASTVRGIINKQGANHHEPSTDYNPELGKYTVAWFKVFLSQTPQAMGVDFKEQIFGTGDESVCGGGDGGMKECKMLSGSL